MDRDEIIVALGKLRTRLAEQEEDVRNTLPPGIRPHGATLVLVTELQREQRALTLAIARL